MKCSKKVLLVMAAVIGTGLLTGCSTKLSPEPFDANLRLTSGHVKTVVRKGQTTRLEVFKALGAPNVIAMESGKGETWTYDQMKVRLPEKQRQVFVMRWWDELSYEEISAITGTSVGALKASYHIAQEKIRSQVADAEIDRAD